MKPFLLPVAVAGAILLGGCNRPSNFELADKDGDGRLSKAEVERALLGTLFAPGDLDGDGKLSFPEIRRADPSYPESRFQARDLDGDSFISSEELDRFAEQTDSFEALIESMDADGDGFIDQEEADRFNERLAEAEGQNPLQRLINLDASFDTP